jgi:hypothetical protein
LLARIEASENYPALLQTHEQEMVAPAQRILADLKGHESQLLQLGVVQLMLFSSAVRGDHQPESDLDFVVELADATFENYMGVKFLLEDLYQRPVDLVLTDTIKPLLRDRILQEAIHAPGF